MMFDDRLHAGEQLAKALANWRGKNALIVAIPRGAVPMAKVIADALDGQLDIVMTRKLHAPGDPEFAIGAVDETGWTYLADYAERAGATRRYIDHEVATELATMRRRRAEYTPGRAPVDPEGRVVIAVDDGLATGATMIAALHALRARSPKWLVCAVPVASTEALEKSDPTPMSSCACRLRSTSTPSASSTAALPKSTTLRSLPCFAPREIPAPIRRASAHLR